MKTQTNFFIAVGMLFVGVVFAGIGLMMPPPGEVDGSVLCLFGEILGFVGALLGIDCHYNSKKG